MSLQPSGEDGARLGDIWNAWQAMCPDPAALSARLGWDADVVATIAAYRDSDVTYSFPTLRDLRRVLAEDFVELACHTPSYELGERCPTLVLCAKPPFPNPFPPTFGGKGG